MEPTEGAATFLTSGDAYDAFMGRYSHQLGPLFVDAAGIEPGDRVLDVGCGPGALSGVLVDRLGPTLVSAIDPSPPFVAECSARFPNVDIRLGRAEAIPFDDAQFDSSLSQLVLHFVTDPDRAAKELCRVVRAGGTVAACIWDSDQEMEMLRHFWDAAHDVDPSAPGDARVLRFGRAGEIGALLEGAGLEDITEVVLKVSSEYKDFGELWSGFLCGIGPAGSFCNSLSDSQRAAVRESFFERVGSPPGSFTLGATARCASGSKPH